MAEVNINLKCDLQHAVKVQYLDGNLFSQDAAANIINIEVTDGGAPATIGGTVSANVIRPDGGTVAVTGGTISGNIVSITLPAACYALVGMITIVVKLSSDSVVTTLAAAVAYVYQSSTDTVVDPGTVVSSIQDLIDAIDTAVASIPADYSSLWTSLAPAFSTSTAYKAGQYVTYDGKLWRFTTDHAAGAWNAAHATQVNVGGDMSDLKSALESDNLVFDDFVYDKTSITFVIDNTNYIDISTKTIIDGTSSNYKCSRAIPVTAGELYGLVCNGHGSAAAYALANDSGIQTVYPASAVSGADYIVKDKIIRIPEGITKIYLGWYNATGVDTQTIYSLSKKTVLKTDLESQVQRTLNDSEIVENAVIGALAADVDSSTAVTQESSYQQLLFNAIGAGRYLFSIESDTATRFDSVRFMHNTTELVSYAVRSTVGPNDTFVYILNYTGSSTINRIRLYNVTTAANIRFRFINLAGNSNALVNAREALNYISNFTANKTALLSWINGKSVKAVNMNVIQDDSNYAIMHLDVKQGDYIHIVFPNGSHLPDGGRYVLSERIIYGTGDNQSAFRGIYTGGQTEYEYIAERDMKMTVCSLKNSSYIASVYQYAVPAYMESADFAAERYQRFHYNETTEKLALTKASYNGYNNSRPKPLTLLHFSDIHDNIINASAIKEFKDKYGSYLNDVICTGDMAGSVFADYFPVYGQTGYTDILLAIGNHDVYDADGTHSGSDDPEYWATGTQKYNQYIAPSVSSWGTIVQPDNAATNGLCYYYKDYSSNGYGYRLIVLDAMAYDDNQHNWFVSALADAKTNSKTVVVAEHFPPITGLSDIEGFNTPFMSLLTGMEYNYAVGRLSTTAGSALDAVDTFINNEGDFACWICGHMHYDQIGKVRSHPNQIFVAVASASRNAVWADQPRYKDTPSEDLFNVICIDPYLKVIKIKRIGATVDDWGRIHDHVSVNYSTGTLIATS